MSKSLKMVESMTDEEYLERLVKNEERIANALEKLNTYIPKMELVLNELQTIKSFIQSDSVRNLAELSRRIEILWQGRESRWRFFAPVIQAASGGLIMWLLTHLKAIP